MPDENLAEEVGLLIRKTSEEAEALKARMDAGEDIDEKELVMLARRLATQIEMARSLLEEAVGPVGRETMHAEMKNRMTPEEYEKWAAGEEQRLAFREDVKREKQLAQDLGEGADKDG